MMIENDVDQNAEKVACAKLLISRGSVFVHINPRGPDVFVPSRLKHQDQVVLQIGLNMPVPIPDLYIGDEKLCGTLSFKGVPFACTVPWSAVFAVVGEDARGRVWEDAVPPSVRNAPPPVPKEEALIASTKRKLPAGWAVYAGGKTG